MARTLPGSELVARRHSRTRFELATEADDPEIRRLLRDNWMAGPIAISLEREPNFFADADLLDETKRTIVAREDGRIVCVGSSTTRVRFVNGEPRTVAYLGGLRLDRSVAGRFDILRRGYEFFQELEADEPAVFYFTSIAAGNERARRFLERGLPGMPRYEFIGEFVTLLLPTDPTARHSRSPGSVVCESAMPAEICDFMNDRGRDYTLRPCWSPGELSALEDRGTSLRIATRNGRIVGCAGLWDQRAFKQTVVRAYAPWLSRLRPLANVTARLRRQPRLPPIGSTLAQAYVFNVVVDHQDAETMIALVGELAGLAKQRGVELLTLGFAANDPRLSTIRGRFSCREFHSRIYRVKWDGNTGVELKLNGTAIDPEVALL